MTGLAGQCRTIAVNHLGFGLSDKPTDWDHLPSSHAANFAAFADHLNLDQVVLVVNDRGGPIALPWALAHPERLAGLVLMNTWCWSANGDWFCWPCPGRSEGTHHWGLAARSGPETPAARRTAARR